MEENFAAPGFSGLYQALYFSGF